MIEFVLSKNNNNEVSVRIREMLNYINKIDLDESQIISNNNRIKNVNNYKKALSILKNIPMLQKDIVSIESSELYSTTQDELYFDTDARRIKLFIEAKKNIGEELPSIGNITRNITSFIRYIHLCVDARNKRY